MIPVKPSDTLAQRLEALGDFFQFAGKVDPVDRVSHVFQTQAPTSPHLDVLVQVPTLSKWQDMNGYHRSANLVILLLFPRPLIQRHVER